MKNSLIASLACLTLVVTANAQYYLYKDLGTAGTYKNIMPTGINNNGDIVGSACDEQSRFVAFRYTGAGGISLIPSPGPAHSAWGYGINSAGTIVGMCDRNGSVLHEFYDQVGFSAVDPDADFSRDSAAIAINDSGYVVGTEGGQPFLGNYQGWIYPLGATLGAKFLPTGLNGNLDVVGNDVWGGSVWNFWTGTRTYLGFALGTWSNHASAINKTGVVAGQVGSQGFLYTPGTPVTLFGAGVATVGGLNANGDVVGCTTAGHAFVYLKKTNQFVDLNTAVSPKVSNVWTLVNASGINDSGQICGQARRLAVPADGLGNAMYVYRAYNISPFVGIVLPYTSPVIP